jgi:RNA polymerase sigma-70 factor (family 1)
MPKDLSTHGSDILKEKIFNGDLPAYELLFKQNYPVLKKYAAKLIRNPQAAEEIASDVLISIWKKRHELPQITFFRAYLYRSVRNACLNFLRAEKRPLDEGLSDDIADLSTPETLLLNSELNLRIQKAVLGLPPKCKACFSLVKEEGLSYKEAAQILGISPKTVDAQLIIALRKIIDVLRTA